MAPNFSKNAILKGPIDFFCLVCEAYLRTEKEGEEHISKVDHKNKLDAVSFIDEFREDHIRKIKNKYFCDYCNKILPVMTRVRLHVTEPLHLENKSRCMIRRYGQFIIAFEDVVIDNKAWQGICEGSCAICNTEYEDEEAHKNDTTHILNTIQMKVEFDDDKNIYRKIDDFTFQCLTCNIVQTFINMTSHFTSNEHIELYRLCQEIFYQECKREIEQFFTRTTESKFNGSKFKKNKTKQNKTDTSKEGNASNQPEDDVEKTESKNQVPKDEVLKKPAEDEKVNDGAEKKIAPKTVDESTYASSKKAEEKICKILDAKDYIIIDENENLRCLLCDLEMKFDEVSKHIAGKHHQIILKLHNDRLETLEKKNSKSVPSEVDMKGKNRAKILDAVSRFQNNGIKINFETKLAVCKRCSIDIQFDYDVIESHIIEHNKNKKPTKVEKKYGPLQVVTECEPTSNDNLLTSPFKRDDPVEETFVINKTEVPMTVNTKNVEASSNSNAGDVAGNGNVDDNNTAGIPREFPPGKIPTKNYIETIVMRNGDLYNKDVIINNKICINYLTFSFMTYLMNRYTMKCYACDEIMDCSALEAHYVSAKHDALLKESLVIEIEGEFIRELRSGHFHCGFCNTLETSWSDMEMHLMTSLHKENNNAALCRLELYEPEITRDLCENAGN